MLDFCDNCRYIFNLEQHDSDRDLVGDVCDNCPLIYNPTQLNNDRDSAGDLCDPDDDNDAFGTELLAIAFHHLYVPLPLSPWCSL